MLSSTCNSSHHQRKRYGYQRYPVKISKFLKVFSPKKTKQFQKWCLHHFSLCFLRGQKHVQNQRSEKVFRLNIPILINRLMRNLPQTQQTRSTRIHRSSNVRMREYQTLALLHSFIWRQRHLNTNCVH
ncbi:Uncharacterized protein APZ42_004328 [Daphnia magna]|uniref:Uncharacterized protein n=1 Tax=Daphnia magna TaxID=35525 RepID=A0A164H4T8_9CRUS|nr:Uncharacterized protein APZ42_004328 [Daphnia magna]